MVTRPVIRPVIQTAGAVRRSALRFSLLPGLVLSLVLLGPTTERGAAQAPEGERREASYTVADSTTVRQRLGELGDSSAAVRHEAQRWLAQHLDLERHWDQIDSAASEGDLEIRRRLAEALAMHDENLALAVRAAASSRSEVADVGREAITEMLARWSPGLGRRGQRGIDVVGEIGPRDARVSLWVEDVPLDELVDRLARLFPGHPALVLDPELDSQVRLLRPDRAQTLARVRGTFAELLLALADLCRVELEGFGFEPGGTRWIRFCKSGDEGKSTGAELITRWCVSVTRDEPAAARAAARALAATGWPAALAWLERRAGDTPGSGPELQGVLLAAGRGLVPPEVMRPETQRALYARADATLEREPIFADSVAHALMAAGPLGPGGDDLSSVAVEGWATLGPGSRWLRLVVLEGQRAARPEALTYVMETIQAEAPGPAAASLRFQALRTLAAMPIRPPEPPALGRPAETWSWVDERDSLDELVDLLLTLRVALPAAWQDVGSAPVDSTRAGRRAVLECALFEALRTGDLAQRSRVSSRFNAFLLEATEREARDKVAAWSRRGADTLLAGLIEERRVTGGGELSMSVLDRLALATGRVPPERQDALLRSCLGEPRTDRERLLTLGALCGGAYRRDAEQVLRGRIQSGAKAEDLAAALVLAWQSLRDGRHELELRLFETRLLQSKLPDELMALIRMGQRRGEADDVEPVERLDRSLRLTGP